MTEYIMFDNGNGEYAIVARYVECGPTCVLRKNMSMFEAEHAYNVLTDQI